MTRKMKKVVAIMLVLVLSVSTVIFVSANPPAVGPADSDAAIHFLPDRGDGVTDPDGPEVPPDVDDPDPGDEFDPADPPDPEETDYLASMSLNFWQHDLEVTVGTARNFHSIRIRNGDWDIGDADDIAEAYDDEVGRYTPGNASVAGMEVYAITATDGWRVTVEIDEFRTVVGGFETLDGSRLRLFPHSTYSGNTAAATFHVVNLETGGAAADIASHTGIFMGGANFEGRLDVPANAAHNGLAEAEMTWTYIAGAPSGGGG